MPVHFVGAKSRLGSIDLWVTIAAVVIAVLMILAATQAQARPVTAPPHSTLWNTSPSRVVIHNGTT
jgi:hypothetical protein